MARARSEATATSDYDIIAIRDNGEVEICVFFAKKSKPATFVGCSTEHPQATFAMDGADNAHYRY